MATLEYLEATGVLIRHEPELEHWEMPERFISITPELNDWLDKTLRLAPKVRGRNLTPHEQVGQTLYDFIIGNPMAYSVNYRKLEPLALHVWELKTEDMRVFGWLAKKRHFVAVCSEFKSNLIPSKKYKPYIEKVREFRCGLPLDKPKAITGITYHDIF